MIIYQRKEKTMHDIQLTAQDLEKILDRRAACKGCQPLSFDCLKHAIYCSQAVFWAICEEVKERIQECIEVEAREIASDIHQIVKERKMTFKECLSCDKESKCREHQRACFSVICGIVFSYLLERSGVMSSEN